MVKTKIRWQLSVSLLCVVFFATACFRGIGDVPQGNVVSNRATETFTPIPPTETPEPTEEPTEEIVDQAVSDVDTDTPTVTPSLTATETPTPTLEATQVLQSGEGGTGDSQPDPFQLTATELIRTATEGVALQQTATALALGIGVATDTPVFTATLDPVFASLTPVGNIQPTQGVVISGADCVHEVRAGETMYRYSVWYGLPVNTIASANGIVNPSLILVGQRIVIPGCGTTGYVPSATSTPTAGTGGSVPGVTPVNTGVCGGQYLIQQYDTLFQISLRCGVAVNSIAAANGITNINYIRMGDTLVIPAQ